MEYIIWTRQLKLTGDPHGFTGQSDTHQNLKKAHVASNARAQCVGSLSKEAFEPERPGHSCCDGDTCIVFNDVLGSQNRVIILYDKGASPEGAPPD